MMKDKKKYAKTSRKRKRDQRPWPLLLAVGGLLLVVAAVFFTGRGDTTPMAPVEVQGQPSLKIDQELVDFGQVKFEQPVYVTFTLSNVGDQTLHFSEKPFIEVLEGC
jgi:hypothetical protein